MNCSRCQRKELDSGICSVCSAQLQDKAVQWWKDIYRYRIAACVSLGLALAGIALITEERVGTGMLCFFVAFCVAAWASINKP